MGDCDVLIAAEASNVRYLTGIAGMMHVLYGRVPVCAVVGPSGTAQVVISAGDWPDTDGREEDAHVYGTFFVVGEDGSYRPFTDRAFADAIADAVTVTDPDAAIVGIDFGLDPDAMGQLRKALAPRELRLSRQSFLRGRQTKDEDELDLMRRANRIAEEALFASVATLDIGVSEREVMETLQVEMVARGARPMLGAIGFGSGSARGDSWPSDRTLREGEPIRIDVGCTVDGYHSDLARTCVLGRPSDWLAETYAALLHGEEAAIAALGPGVPAREVFSIAVDAVRAAGLQQYRRTHCGHGIGLDIYEEPLIAPRTTQTLAQGMTICVETPFYDERYGGVQVEDAFVITASGAERLGSSSRELIVLT
jgi:Xaa-Pro aminopeptidase